MNGGSRGDGRQNRTRTFLFIRLKQYLLARWRAVKVVTRGARERTICAVDYDESMDTPERVVGNLFRSSLGAWGSLGILGL